MVEVASRIKIENRDLHHNVGLFLLLFKLLSFWMASIASQTLTGQVYLVLVVSLIRRAQETW